MGKGSAVLCVLARALRGAGRGGAAPQMCEVQAWQWEKDPLQQLTMTETWQVSV